jgi:hypothetical protein
VTMPGGVELLILLVMLPLVIGVPILVLVLLLNRRAAQRGASSVPSGTAPPPSWQRDPFGRFEYRWWDGLRWTEHVTTADALDTDPIPPPGDATRRDGQR